MTTLMATDDDLFCTSCRLLDQVDAEMLITINELIATRLQAKLGRRFDEADKVKAQLESMGVRLQDRSKEWRYKKFEPLDYGPLGHDYQHAEVRTSLCRRQPDGHC